MKSLNHKSLDISMQRQQWATHPINEKKLNRAFQVSAVSVRLSADCEPKPRSFVVVTPRNMVEVLDVSLKA